MTITEKSFQGPFTNAITAPAFDSGSLTNADIDAALEEIGTIRCEHLSRLLIGVTVTGADTDQFEIMVRANESSSYVTAAAAAADYTSPSGLFVLKASQDMTLITATVTAWTLLDVTGVQSVKLSAASGTSNSALSVQWGGN